MSEQKAKTVFQVIETETGEVVHTVDVTGRSERAMDRIEKEKTDGRQ